MNVSRRGKPFPMGELTISLHLMDNSGFDLRDLIIEVAVKPAYPGYRKG
jgi:hypothetical protein